MTLKASITVSAFDRALQRDGVLARRAWERSLSGVTTSRHYNGIGRGVTGVFRLIGDHANLNSVGRLIDLISAISAALSGATNLRVGTSAGSLGKVFVFGAVTTTACAATVATLAVKGYVDHPASFWRQRIAERMHSPIFDSDKTLIGSVDTVAALPAHEAANLAYIPLQGDVPKTFERALLAAENKTFYDDGVRNWCGIDPLSLARPLLTLRKGGSGLAQQLAGQLKVPEWSDADKNPLTRVYYASMKLGAACALHKTLVADGGKAKVLREYANYAPMWQGKGVLRGIEAASNVVFGVSPGRLTDGQQLILAAAVKEPLRLASAESISVPCESLYPRVGNPSFDASLAAQKQNWARANQCRVLHRAISKANLVLSGAALQSALNDLRGYQRDGIQPVNPFETISPKKLVNLSTRTRAAMSSGFLNEVRREAEALSQPGEPLVLSMDGVKQHDFSEAMTASLQNVQRSAKGRQILCMPLVEDLAGALVLRKCSEPTLGDSKADVLAIKINVASGSVQQLYASSPLILDSAQSIGSLAKWVIALAAVADGVQADTLVCPREAFDGTRQLLRVEAPTQGYANCDHGQHLTTLEQATARSDNLAFYDLARQLGRSKLERAAAALGFVAPTASFNWEYELAFGTFGAKPRQLVAAAQRLVAVTYETKLTGIAPHVLAQTPSVAAESTRALRQLLNVQEKREAMRRLLSAPVTQARGTLSYLRGEIDAGKTGTTQSVALDQNGRRHAHGKWSLTYQRTSGELNLMMVASPLPSVPLAHHSIDGSLLAPALRTLLSANKE